MTKIKVRKKITTVTPYYSSLESYIQELKNAVNSLPQEYNKDSALITRDCDDYSDEYVIWLTAEREETDKEYEQRKISEELTEKYRRQQYENLKKIYEGK